MKHLLMKKLLLADGKERINMSMGGKCVNAQYGRKEMLRVIDAFKKEGERRQSYVKPNHDLATLICRRRSSSPYQSKSKSPPRIE